jgi:D-alanyl-D-alanine carboxypeptidase
VALGLTVLLAACGGAGRNDAATPLEHPKLDRLLASYVDEADGAVGVIAFVRTPAGTWRGAAGSADLARGRALREGDRFRVGSITKTFTATVLLQLVAEHKLSLEDTLARRLPGAFPQGSRITLRQLLNHTSGIRDARDKSSHP